MKGSTRFGGVAVLVFLALATIFCDSPEAPDMTKSTCFVIPRISGIYLTSGYEPWGKWRDPDGLFEIYKNPSMPPMAVQYYLLSPAHVRVWVVPALEPDDIVDSVSSNMGGDFIRPLGVPLEVLKDTVYNHRYRVITIWDGTDSHGDDVPAGFYRIYIQVDDELYWYDYFLYRDRNEVPSYIWP